MTAQAGWFPDPRGSEATFRWWDGATWTSWLSHDPAGPAPHTVEPTAAEPTAAEPTAAEPGTDRERAVRTPVVVAVTAVVVALSLVGVGIVVHLSTPTVAAGPAVEPPARIETARLAYDRSSRRGALGRLSLVLPAAPFRCLTDTQDRFFMFTQALNCSADVHTGYDGSKVWTADAGMGLLGETYVVEGDLKKTGEKAFLAVRRLGFAGYETRLTDFTASRTPYGDPAEVLLFSGDVHYAIKGLPSRYDRIQVVVATLSDGGYGVVYSLRPQMIDAATLKPLRAALDTFAVR